MAAFENYSLQLHEHLKENARKNTGSKHKAKTSVPMESVGSCIHHHKEEYPVGQGIMKPPGLKELPAPRGMATMEFEDVL